MNAYRMIPVEGTNESVGEEGCMINAWTGTLFIFTILFLATSATAPPSPVTPPLSLCTVLRTSTLQEVLYQLPGNRMENRFPEGSGQMMLGPGYAGCGIHQAQLYLMSKLHGSWSDPALANEMPRKIVYIYIYSIYIYIIYIYIYI